METMIQAATLTGYFQVAFKHGINSLELLRQVGIDAVLLTSPEHRLPVTAVCELLERSAAVSGCTTFGLEMAELRQKRDVGAIGLLLAHKRTLREALLAAQQYRHLLNDALGLYIENAGDTVVIREEIISDAPHRARQATELAVGVLTKIFRALLGPNWHPRSVNFTHPEPADSRMHRSFFACPVHFSSEFNGIVCNAADLDAPNPAADLALVRYAESLAAPLNAASPDSLVADVRKAVYLLLPLEQANIDKVAQHLHMSTRTLQRRLDDLDVDFSAVLAGVRHELAVRYLSNPRFSLGRIAALLGYARQASFTRWFSARFGMTPRAWRATRI
ncbi:AraC family transcriptional regulator [Crenobacter sp. SG2303]|uniref:AraC family transcriptional regulator n=1 Tax=Crenobacter oryzisoli TaxID=3056844 RepID=A0ABT7XT08_9NEIS|nr:AraC family transcriptional regulator [Crenobacter sp. SG2303]MDN0076937.1 AraC family transcriptional regulator [Crenobacter sp. SG2303]